MWLFCTAKIKRMCQWLRAGRSAAGVGSCPGTRGWADQRLPWPCGCWSCALASSARTEPCPALGRAAACAGRAECARRARVYLCTPFSPPRHPTSPQHLSPSPRLRSPLLQELAQGMRVVSHQAAAEVTPEQGRARGRGRTVATASLTPSFSQSCSLTLTLSLFATTTKESGTQLFILPCSGFNSAKPLSRWLWVGPGLSPSLSAFLNKGLDSTRTPSEQVVCHSKLSYQWDCLKNDQRKRGRFNWLCKEGEEERGNGTVLSKTR